MESFSRTFLTNLMSDEIKTSARDMEYIFYVLIIMRNNAYLVRTFGSGYENSLVAVLPQFRVIITLFSHYIKKKKQQQNYVAGPKLYIDREKNAVYSSR